MISSRQMRAPFDFDRRTLVFFFLGQGVLIFLCAVCPLVVPAATVGILFLWLASRHPFFAVNSLILLHIFIVESTEGVSVPEVFVGLLLFYVVSIWFFKKGFLEQTQVVFNRADCGLILFLSSCVFSLIPAVLFGVFFSRWVRELVPFMTFMLFFPLRDALRNKKDVQIVVAMLFILCLFAVFRNLVRYRSAIAIAEMYWQIASSRAASNEPFFFVSIVLAVSVLLFTVSWKVRILMSVLVSVFALALIITFSRGYWIATGIAFIVLFILSPLRTKIKILLFTGIVVMLSGMVVMLFFGDFGRLLLESVFGRFVTIGSFLEDPSFRSRLAESAKVIGYILRNPILGYGLGKEYEFVSIIPREMPTAYVHNVYLFLMFKIGLAGTLMFLYFYGRMIRQGYRNYRIQTDAILKAVMLGVLSYLIAMLPLSVSSPQFIQKDSILLIAVGMAILSFGEQYSLRKCELNPNGED